MRARVYVYAYVLLLYIYYTYIKKYEYLGRRYKQIYICRGGTECQNAVSMTAQ